jgi:hypothetical protein
LNNDDVSEHFAHGQAKLLLGAISMKNQKLTEAEIDQFKLRYEKFDGTFDEKKNEIALSDIGTLYKKVIDLGGFREAVAEDFFKKNPSIGEMSLQDRANYEKYLFKFEKSENEPTKLKLTKSDGVTIDKLKPELLLSVPIFRI